jgi:hypothetical protein
MRTLLSVAAMAGLTLSLMAGGFAATQADKPAAKVAKAVAKKCPACGMTLSTKKTKNAPQAVKIGKTTYYCCSACDMSKKDTPHHEKKEKTPG